MAFGHGTKPAFAWKTPKKVETSHKGPSLNLPKPTARGGGVFKKPAKGCCGH